jgi:hypothetical protein
MSTPAHLDLCPSELVGQNKSRRLSGIVYTTFVPFRMDLELNNNCELVLHVHKWPMSSDMVEPMARTVAGAAGLNVLHASYITHSNICFMPRRYPSCLLRRLVSVSRFVRKALEVFDWGSLSASAAMCEGAVQAVHS